MNVKLKKNSDRRLRNAHQWVFSNELIEIPKFEPGSIVDVYSFDSVNFGKAFYNPNSLISCRLLKTFDEIKQDFFTKRIKNALEFRKNFFSNQDIYRLVFGESDFLPGLIIDKYLDYFAIQILSFGMEKNKQLIFDAIIDVFPETKGIIEKNISKLREIEGLDSYENIVYGEIPKSIFAKENNINLNITLQDSQKTGYFLDQKINRKFIQRIANNKTVLDLFCNQGGFALNAVKGGALSALGIDSSSTAILQSRENAEINNFKNADFEIYDVFDFLKDSIKNNKKWDLVIIDPPAFAKSKKDIKNSSIAYSRLNNLGLRCTNNLGFIASSSCSQHISEEQFFEIINKEANKLNYQLKLIYRGLQSPDHPILISMPETKYLKFLVFQVIKNF